MKIKSVELETVCGITSKLPENNLPEIAFAGKSNVGKSSLINTLVNRKSLARTSQSPGKTQTINFYNLNKELYLVDLPGYGYAEVSIETRAKWGKMIEKYLQTTKQLKAVFLLIDIRHKPSENDCIMYDWIVKTGYNPIIICTKSDKISKGATAKNLKIIRDTLGCSRETVMIPFSALNKSGRDDIYRVMDACLGIAEGEEQ
jgi:GTP-binding protein